VSQDLYAEACSVCVSKVRDTAIVEVAGEVDIASSSLLAKALADASKDGQFNVIVDAQHLTYIDSIGVATLLTCRDSVISHDRRFALVGCHGIFYKLVEITRLTDKFRMFQSVDEALAALP